MGGLYTENRISGTEEMKEIIIREQEKEIHIKTEKEAGESQKKNQGKKKCYEGEAMTLFAAADKIFKIRESFSEKQAVPIAAPYGRTGRSFAALRILAVIMLWTKQ